MNFRWFPLEEIFRGMIIGGNEERQETVLTEDEGRGGGGFPVFSHAYLVLILFKLPAGNKLFHIRKIH